MESNSNDKENKNILNSEENNLQGTSNKIEGEIYFGTEKYISSKQAAAKYNYTSDHLASLCRNGKVKSQRVGKAWYLAEESLISFIQNIKLQKQYQNFNKSPLPTNFANNSVSNNLESNNNLEKEEEKEKPQEQKEEHKELPIRTNYSPANLLKTLQVITLSFLFMTAVFFGILTNENLTRGAVVFHKGVNTGAVIIATNISNNETVRVATNYTAGFFKNNVLTKYFENSIANIYCSIDSLSENDILCQSENAIASNLGELEDKKLAQITIVQEPREVIETINKTVVIESPVKIIERVVQGNGITQSTFDTGLEILRNELKSEIYSKLGNITSGSNTIIQNVYKQIAQTNRIDELSSVDITGATITNSSFAGTAGTFTGEISGSRFIATDTSATSTFAGGLTIEDSGFVYDFSTNNVGIGTTSPFATLSVAGDIYADGTFTASTFAATSSISAPFFTATGASATSTFAGGLTVNTSTFIVDPDGGRVGIGTASPGQTLVVTGDAQVTTNLGIGTGPNSNWAVRAQTNSTVDGASGIRASSEGNVVGTSYGGHFIVEVGSPTTAVGVYGSATVGTNSYAAIFENGNVGIGSTTPFAKLSVHGLNGETNTRLFEVASSTASATTTHLVVTNTGNVGIGTAAPGELLHLETSSAQLIAQLKATGDNPVQITGDANRSGASSNIFSILARWNGNNVADINFVAGDDTTNKDEGFINFGTAPAGGGLTERMRINKDGNVGIGTTSPWGLLSVNPNGIIGPSFTIGSSTQTDFIVTNAGNVGIGTTSPSAKLAVDGLGVFGLPDKTDVGQITITSASDVDSEAVDGYGFSYGSANSASRSWRLVNDNSGWGYFDIEQTTTQTGSTWDSKLTIDNTGNVGIGSTTPFAKLSVHGQNGDTNLRLFEIASSTVNATTTHLVVTNTGNIGIGTASPLGKLHIETGSGLTLPTPSGDGDELVIMNKTAGENAGISIITDNATTGNIFFGDEQDADRGGVSYRQGTNERLFFTSGAGERMTILATTEVGIGTTSPWGLLSVNPNGIGTSPEFVIGSSTQTDFIVTNAGNVGIGTAAPSTALDIEGGVFTLDADADTTIDSASDDTLLFKTGGTERLRIAASNILGISVTPETWTAGN